MIKKVSIEIQLTEADFLKFSLQRFYRSFLGRSLTILGLLLLIIPLFLYLLKPEVLNGRVPVFQWILGALFTLGVPLILFRASKRALLANVQLIEPTHYDFDSKGISIIGLRYKEELPWNKIFKIVENDTFILIYVTKVSSHIIPKSNLNQDELTILRKTLRSIPELNHSLF